VSPHHLISPAVECNLLLLSSITPSPYCFHFRYNAAELLKGNVPTREVKGSNVPTREVKGSNVPTREVKGSNVPTREVK